MVISREHFREHGWRLVRAVAIAAGASASMLLAIAVPGVAAELATSPPALQNDVTQSEETEEAPVTLSARQRRKALARERRALLRQEREHARGAPATPTVKPSADAGAVNAAASDIAVSFMLDRQLTRSLYMGDRWVSPPVYSVTRDGVLVVDARAHGRDSRGRPLTIKPRWIPSEPALVSVSPGDGAVVRITVHRAGESRLDVVVENDAKEAVVTKELHIKAIAVGGALRAEIDTTRATVRGTGASRVETQNRSTVTNGWKYVDADGKVETGASTAATQPARPAIRNGWRYVD